MPDLELLAEMLHVDARIPVTNYHGKGTAVLTEPECEDSRVEIYGLPLDAIIVKVDKFPAPRELFQNTRGECKRADYAIIVEKNNRTVVVYLEMKRTKALLHDITKQLTGARCVMHYCQEIGKTFWNDNNFLSNACHRFVSVGHTSIPKMPTRIDRNAPNHDRPDRMLKIVYPHKLQFNMLTGQIP